MKIKIADKIYDPNEQPIMVMLTDKDKENIANMADQATKYCVYPEGTDKEEIEEFMNNPGN